MNVQNSRIGFLFCSLHSASTNETIVLLVIFEYQWI
jgi:hypothetical protein